MACGDIFQKDGDYYLQLVERENDDHAPFVLLTEESEADEVIGCDPEFPFFFIRKRTDGKFPDKNYFINVFEDEIIPLETFTAAPVETLKRVHMQKIQECAKIHDALKVASYKYLNLV